MWTALDARIANAASVVESLSALTGPPLFCDSSGSDRGYRYSQPGRTQYCILKSAKAVVAFRSAIVVAQAGFHTEVGTLIRVVAECCTLVHWVAGAAGKDAQAEYVSAVDLHVERYFADRVRTADAIPEVGRTKQSRVHRMHGKTLDELDGLGGTLGRPSEELMESVYRRFSKYVHAAYPETVDLFGRRLGVLDLSGSSGSAKDLESAEVLEVFATTVGNAVAAMVALLEPALIEKLRPPQQRWVYSMLGRQDLADQ